MTYDRQDYRGLEITVGEGDQFVECELDGANLVAGPSTAYELLACSFQSLYINGVLNHG